jgi:hypothetical protein
LLRYLKKTLRKNTAGTGSALAFLQGVTDDELEAIVERANDPSLIPGIYNWCDRRCERCAFSARCFQFRLARADGDEMEHASRRDRQRNRDDTLPAQIGGVFDRTIDLMRAIGRRIGMDVAELDRAMDAGLPADMTNRMDAAGGDPLVTMACGYAADVHPIVRVLAPVVAIRGDQASIDAVDDIEWYATLVSGKTYRAVLSSLEFEDAGRTCGPEVVSGWETDTRGSAKCARLFIAASIQAWRVLMEVGRATAHGVPARLVQVLTDLDRGLAARFPDAMSFVRPGFDESATPAATVQAPGAFARGRRPAIGSAEVKIEQ